MNPDLPPDNRAGLESRVTALLLGELSAEEAAALRQTMAQDADLAKLHERLRLTLGLVRETAATPASEIAGQPASLKLSAARREALLARFKTINVPELAQPRAARKSWVVPLAAAAAIVLIAGVLFGPEIWFNIRRRSVSNQASATSDALVLAAHMVPPSGASPGPLTPPTSLAGLTPTGQFLASNLINDTQNRDAIRERETPLSSPPRPEAKISDGPLKMTPIAGFSGPDSIESKTAESVQELADVEVDGRGLRRAGVVNSAGSNVANMAQDSTVVTEVIPVHSLNPVQAVKELSALRPAGSELDVNEGGNAITMTGKQSDIGRFSRMIQTLDNSGSGDIQVRKLTNADPKEIASELKNVFSTEQNSPVADRPFAIFGRGRGGGFGGGGESIVSSAPKVAAFSDDQNNALVVRAPADIMPGISNLAGKLDIQKEDQMEIRPFLLRHADPTDMANAVASLFPNNSTNDSRKNQSTVNAVPDTRTKSVVVMASKDTMGGIEKMVAELDGDPVRGTPVYVFRPQNGDVAAIQQPLQELFASSASRGSTMQNNVLQLRAQQAAQESTLSTSGTNLMGTAALAESVNPGGVYSLNEVGYINVTSPTNSGDSEIASAKSPAGMDATRQGFAFDVNKSQDANGRAESGATNAFWLLSGSTFTWRLAGTNSPVPQRGRESNLAMNDILRDRPANLPRGGGGGGFAFFGGGVGGAGGGGGDGGNGAGGGAGAHAWAGNPSETPPTSALAGRDIGLSGTLTNGLVNNSWSGKIHSAEMSSTNAFEDRFDGINGKLADSPAWNGPSVNNNTPVELSNVVKKDAADTGGVVTESSAGVSPTRNTAPAIQFYAMRAPEAAHSPGTPPPANSPAPELGRIPLVGELFKNGATPQPQLQSPAAVASPLPPGQLVEAEKMGVPVGGASAQPQSPGAKTTNVIDLSDASAPNTVVPPPTPQPEVQTVSNAFSTFSLNVSDVSFKLAAASLAIGRLPDPGTVRSEEFINAFDYRDAGPAPGAPIGFAWDRAGDSFAHNRDFLRFAVKTAAQGRDAARPLNVVLLLDKSGSMERAGRVAIIREALRVLASELQPRDTLSVVVFARTARLWADGVPGNQAGALADALEALTPEGGTNLEEAMKLAYETALRHYLANGENRVVVLTDGAANLGEVKPEALEKKVEANRAQGIALDCFGVGWEDYNDHLLEELSRTGGGRYGFVNTPEEAATEFVGQLAGALCVAASDVKVQVEFNSNRVVSYRQIGYAKDQLAKEQFRDNTVKAAQLSVQEAGNALYTVELKPAGDGPICTVRMRYRDPGTSDYHEHEWEVPYTGPAVALDQASPAMRLAAGASAFSEWLAGSPYASEVSLDQLQGLLRGVPEFYGADTRPKHLEEMIREARSISGK